MREAVLQIYYTDKYKKLHKEPQGKFYYENGKPIYLADMTPNKWWRNYGGYSIAKQILEAFSKLKLRPQIVYRVRERGTLYMAKITDFRKKGIMVAYGSHEQYVLPIKSWKGVQAALNDPKGLPVMNLADWMKTTDIDASTASDLRKPQEYRYEGNTAIPIEVPVPAPITQERGLFN
jgi:hypothetical protein